MWVYGPWFIRPSDTKFYDTKAFYPNEVLMSSIADMNHINRYFALLPPIVFQSCEILSFVYFLTWSPLVAPQMQKAEPIMPSFKDYIPIPILLLNVSVLL